METGWNSSTEDSTESILTKIVAVMMVPAQAARNAQDMGKMLNIKQKLPGRSQSPGNCGHGCGQKSRQ
ncbi:hypothetical protein SRHO_G00094680 [Serrasalmus rhombeus]